MDSRRKYLYNQRKSLERLDKELSYAQKVLHSYGTVWRTVEKFEPCPTCAHVKDPVRELMHDDDGDMVYCPPFRELEPETYISATELSGRYCGLSWLLREVGDWIGIVDAAKFVLPPAYRDWSVPTPSRRRARTSEGGVSWAAVRKQALVRDGEACVVCHHKEDVHVHHIIPVAKGGADVLENLVTLCPNHHTSAHRKRISAKKLRSLQRKASHEDTHQDAPDAGRRQQAEESLHDGGHDAPVLQDSEQVERQEVEEGVRALPGAGGAEGVYPQDH